MADTTVNREVDEETLFDITRLARNSVEYFAHDPIMAMVSYSNFGSHKEKEPEVARRVVERMHEAYPDLPIDGEMQMSYALNKKPATPPTPSRASTARMSTLSSSPILARLPQPTR